MSQTGKHQKCPWKSGKETKCGGKCEQRPCAVSHMNEQPHMTYPPLLWILFFWAARRYFQPQQTAPWLIHDGGRGWIKYSSHAQTHTNVYTSVLYSRQSFWFQQWKNINAERKTKQKKSHHRLLWVEEEKGRGLSLEEESRGKILLWKSITVHTGSMCVCMSVYVCVCVHVSRVAVADGRKMTPEFDRRETGQAITHWNTQTHTSWKCKWRFCILPRLHSVIVLSLFERPKDS